MCSRSYCTTCDDYGHCEHDHKEIRTALFDYMACKTIEAFEGWEEEEDDGVGR